MGLLSPAVDLNVEASLNVKQEPPYQTHCQLLYIGMVKICHALMLMKLQPSTVVQSGRLTPYNELHKEWVA